ncbi:sigma-70 family RNA polymerase sigma factor [Demequina phytophila]|uniref:sigma-70 family RNA polymerase sigma factor n=1 Tax=Demequina phytophila TaxID=1638981 RepID=UPI0009E5BA26|nr:sigma-70 family RNA polymerase sigma factor [Demequina phytophila]
MSQEALSLWTETSSDPELIAGVRAGDPAAFGVLYERHADAARKVAFQYTNTAADAEDVVSEAFSRILRALQQGDGPDLAFRAYLFTIVRRTGLDIIEKANRARPRDDMSPFESAIGYEAGSDEPALESFEQSMVADAFRSLPERWRAVLWYTEIEKKSPKEIAPLLGLSANGVAALAYRAREALRQAYLQQHLNVADTVNCLEANAQLGSYVRGGLSKREHSRVDEHVRNCDKCAALVAELEDVNRGLRAVVAPLFLGLLGVKALEGGLPVGGALGEGAAAASSSASAVSAASGASAASSVSGGAAAGGFAAFANAIAAIALPAAATIGVVSLIATGASVFGIIGETSPGDAGAQPAAIDATGDEDDAAVGGATTSPSPSDPSDDVPGDETTEIPADDASDGPTDEVSGVPGFVPVVTDAPGTDDGSTPGVDDPNTSGGGDNGGGDNGGGDNGGGDNGGGDNGGGDNGGGDNGGGDNGGGDNGGGDNGGGDNGGGDNGGGDNGGGDNGGGDNGGGDNGGGDNGGGDNGGGDNGGGDNGGGDPTPRTALSIAAPPLNFLSISRTAPAVSLDLSNGGEDAAADVTASIVLPEGLTFSAPAGGGGGSTPVSTDALESYLEFAFASAVTVGDWTCEVSDDRREVECTLDSLGAGAATAINIDLSAITAAQELADDAVTVFSASSGDDAVTFSVRTALEPVDDPDLDPDWEGTGRVAATVVGSPLLGCDLAVRECQQVMSFTGSDANDRYDNDTQVMRPLNLAGGVTSSSETVLGTDLMPEGSKVLSATLTWSANRSFLNGWTGDLADARLRAPGGEYVDVTADDVETSTDLGYLYYQATADITDVVAAGGNGGYALADIALPRNYWSLGGNYYAGFAITIVYENEDLPQSSIVVLDGSHWLYDSQADIPFHTDGGARVTLGMVAFEGDRGKHDNRISIDGDTLNPNGWNGKNVVGANSGNAADSTAFGSAFGNSLGTDAKLFKPKKVGAGDHTVQLSSGTEDAFLLSSLVLTITPDK